MKTRKIVKEITYQICAGLIDVLLYSVYLTGASIGKSGPRGVHEAFREADATLLQFNHKTLANTWHHLAKKRLISYQKRGNLYNAEITAQGKERLKKLIPAYQKRRTWDRKIYLITYDIPESSHTKRDKLRSFLKRLGCKLLQESTWIALYNPRQLLEEFNKKYKIPGAILVSDIGQDGGIGETTLQDLLIKLYELENLNDRYGNFIKNAREKKQSTQFLLFEYLSILKDDPQLPFELLPPGWLGDKAHYSFENLQKNYNKLVSRPRR